MSNKSQSAVSIAAAIIVLLSAMWDARISIALAVIALAGLGIYQLMTDKRAKDDLAGNPLQPEVAQKRRENLDKIMQLAQSLPQITNDDVQKSLGVSDATATRYLEYLVNLNQLVQIGDRGQQVSYRRIS